MPLCCQQAALAPGTRPAAPPPQMAAGPDALAGREGSVALHLCTTRAASAMDPWAMAPARSCSGRGSRAAWPGTPAAGAAIPGVPASHAGSRKGK
jgi:hypothetical protein